MADTEPKQQAPTKISLLLIVVAVSFLVGWVSSSQWHNAHQTKTGLFSLFVHGYQPEHLACLESHRIEYRIDKDNNLFVHEEDRALTATVCS